MPRSNWPDALPLLQPLRRESRAPQLQGTDALPCRGSGPPDLATAHSTCGPGNARPSPWTEAWNRQGVSPGPSVRPPRPHSHLRPQGPQPCCFPEILVDDSRWLSATGMSWINRERFRKLARDCLLLLRDLLWTCGRPWNTQQARVNLLKWLRLRAQAVASALPAQNSVSFSSRVHAK